MGAHRQGARPGARRLEGVSLTLAPGRGLSHYRLVEQIGEGGMGVVWRAADTTLGRDVAIKVLPETFARDAERMARFEREAKILAALNHPHVAAIYGLASDAGVRFLAMELVEGDDLGARIAGGPLPIVEALEIARQIAEALEAAHEKGIIHRDLKPANVRVTADGQVKVLDFGLAKALEGDAAAPAASAMSQSPTITGLMTGANVILGTAAYMSPEQARGKTVDRRADIWAFGCVLYECLTSRRAFAGETVSDTLAKILERDPDLAALPGGTPARVRELLQRCLDKDPRHRLRDIGDARIVLEEVLAARSPSGRLLAVDAPGAVAAGRRGSSILLALMGVAGLVAGAILWSLFGPRAGGGAPGARCVTVGMPPDVIAHSVDLTPDGKTLIVRGRPKSSEGNRDERLYARPLSAYAFQEIPGSLGVTGYAFDRGSRNLYLILPVAPGAPQRRLARIPLDGSGPPTTISDWKDSWTGLAPVANGDFLITDGPASFIRLPKGGGAPSAPVRIDARRAGVSQFILDTYVLPGDRGAFVNVVAYDARGWHYSVGVLDPRSGKVKVVEEDGGFGTYSPTGHLLFSRGDAVLAVPFDVGRLEARGAPVAVWNGLSTPFTFLPGQFALTSDGGLLYQPGQVGGDRQLCYLDGAGRLVPWSPERRAVDQQAEISPDGRRFMVSIANARGIDELWIGNLDHPELHRLGTDPNADCAWAAWSPDGKRIAYLRNGKDAQDGIYLQDAEGGEAKRIFKSESDQIVYRPTAWLPDGSALLLWRIEGGKSSIVRATWSGNPDSTRVRPLMTSSYNQFYPRVSPNGRLLAYNSDESGQPEPFVVELRPDGSVGRPIRTGITGGGGQRWSFDSKALYAQDQRNRVMKVLITSAPQLSASAPSEVFDLDKLGIALWSILPDGRFFVGLKNQSESDITSYNLVLNWTEILKQKMAAAR